MSLALSSAHRTGPSPPLPRTPPPASPPASQAPRPAPWVVLASIPGVSSSDAEITAGDDFTFDWRDPLRVSLLTMRRSRFVSPVPEDISPDHEDYPYVVAVDNTGVVLLRARADKPRSLAIPGYDSGTSRDYVDAYIYCDAYTRRATRLSPEFVQRFVYVGNVGIICEPPDEEGYLDHTVAELQPVLGTGRAILQRFSMTKPPHDPKEVNYPPGDRPWGSHGVISHAGKLWWVDLTYGLLSCNPFADDPEMHFLALPAGCELPAGTEDLAKRRCVRVSDGKLLYVQIHDGPEPDGAPTVSTWKLAGAAEELVWEPQNKVRIGQIWDNKTYRNSQMPRSVPVLALVHPKKPDVVCFFQFTPENSWLFSVNLRTRKVLKCDKYAMPHPGMAHHSSRFVHAWELPPSICRADDGSDDDDKCDCLSFLCEKLMNCCQLGGQSGSN